MFHGVFMTLHQWFINVSWPHPDVTVRAHNMEEVGMSFRRPSTNPALRVFGRAEKTFRSPKIDRIAVGTSNKTNPIPLINTSIPWSQICV